MVLAAVVWGLPSPPSLTIPPPTRQLSPFLVEPVPHWRVFCEEGPVEVVWEDGQLRISSRHSGGFTTITRCIQSSVAERPSTLGREDKRIVFEVLRDSGLHPRTRDAENGRTNRRGARAMAKKTPSRQKPLHEGVFGGPVGRGDGAGGGPATDGRGVSGEPSSSLLPAHVAPTSGPASSSTAGSSGGKKK